jgi:hypothetical protein
MNRRLFLQNISAVAASSQFVVRAARAAASEYVSTEPESPIFLLEASTVEDHWETRRKLNPLVKSSGNPILLKDRDWEGSGPYVYGSVLYDPEDKLLKCWYTVFHDTAYRQHTRGSYMTCYATSQNGYEWTKPELGLVDWNGSRRNNFVRLGHQYNAPLAVVPVPLSAHRRWRYIGLYLDAPGVCLAASEDGKLWHDLPGSPIERHESDTFNCIVYDSLRRKWLAYIRPPIYAGTWKRRVALMESSDLATWTHPETILVPDEGDVPEFYGMPVFRRGNLFFGLLEVYDAPRGSIEIELVFSSDGRHWDRVPPHEIFLGLGGPGEFDHGVIVTSNSPVIVDGETRLYYGGTKTDHNTRTVNDEPISAIGMASITLDRFYGVTNAHDQTAGFILTRPLVLNGSTIALNGVIRGEARIALLDLNGNEIQGFSLKDCTPIRGDGLRLPVAWGANKTIKAGVFRLKLQINDATVYALYVK